MIRKSPFDNIQKSISSDSNNNFNNFQINEQISHLPPPKQNNFNFPSQKITPPHKKSDFREANNSNNYKNIQFYKKNNNDNGNNDEFNLILNEYESKIKNINYLDGYITTISKIFPSNIDTYNQLNMQLSINLCPLFNNGIELPLIDYNEKEIPRCNNKNCRAYLNPFVKFIDEGEKWICNICGQISQTENYFYNSVDKNGIRIDINEKPELCNTSYEFVANKNIYKKEKVPTEATFYFIFETSNGAIDNGFLTASIESVKDAISNEIFYNGNNIKIGILTYNLGIDFYSYNNKFTQPQMLTVNDEQIFLPTNTKNLIFNLKSEKDKILQILELIQNTFNKNNQNITNNNCKDSLQIFNAITGAYLLGKGIGGKILIFSSSNIINSIKMMNETLEKNETKEQKAYSIHDGRKIGNMGINLTNENISCDVFACAENKINTLTLNQICEYTNGHFYFYKNFNLDLNYKNIFNQIRRVLSRPICWEGLNFVRLSHGYKVSTYSAPFLITNLGYFVFPTGDSDQNYLINVEPPSVTTEDEKTKSNNYNKIDDNRQYLYIQNSLFYSYGDGTRRIRIHNLCIPLSSNVGHIYKKINPELLASFYLKETINKIYKNKNISNSILSTDDQFKHFIDKVKSIENRMNRELMPNLTYLPLYMIGMFKHRIFCKDEIDKNYDLDISNYLRVSLQKMSYQEITSFICPSIYSLHEFENNKKLGTYDSITKEFNIPNVISLSKSAMEENGLYLIDNGYLLIIYIRKNVSQYILLNLFGVENLSFLTMIINEENVFGEESNEFKDRIKNLLDYIRAQKSIFQNLIFVFEGAGGERIINEALIEDNYCSWYPMNYYNFYNKYIKENTLAGY